MKKIKKTIITTSENLDTKEITNNKQVILQTIRTWEELTEEEKEEQIEKDGEIISQFWYDEIYEDFKNDLNEYLKQVFKQVDFDTIYIDENSQGIWIDEVKGFKYNDYDYINIYGEDIQLDDIDLHIRKYIEPITENDINIYDYYISDEKLERIKKTKKYKNFIDTIIKNVNEWIEEANKVCKCYMDSCYYPLCTLDEEEKADWLNNFYCDIEFTDEKDITNEEEKEIKNDDK